MTFNSKGCNNGGEWVECFFLISKYYNLKLYYHTYKIITYTYKSIIIGIGIPVGTINF